MGCDPLLSMGCDPLSPDERNIDCSVSTAEGSVATPSADCITRRFIYPQNITTANYQVQALGRREWIIIQIALP